MSRRPTLPRRRPATAAGLAVLCLLAAVAARGERAGVADSPIDIRIEPPGALAMPTRGPAPAQRPARPLTGDESARLAVAQDHRLAGRFRQAAAALAPLVAAAPHHPAVVTEQVRLRLAQDDLAGAQRLAREERAAQQDSLLAARELVFALERLERPLDAAGVVLEAWVASPTVADWAQGTLLRLAAADMRGVRERAHRAARARAGRADLALACALLDVRAGDPRGALAGLEAAEQPGGRAPLRLDFAERSLEMGTPGDSAVAIAALVALAGDVRFPPARRLVAGERAWGLQAARSLRAEAAPGLARALRDVPTDQWPVRLLAELARALREGGHTETVREMLRPGTAPGAVAPPIELEAALADLRDGPPERALARLAALAPDDPAAAWYHAEALFFAGQADSALERYQRIAADPREPYGGAALERVFLIEDAEPREALAVFGRIAYDEWRGERGHALVLTDSLVRGLPRGPLWAQAALLLSGQRVAAGDAAGALAPLLAVADSLPGDRLAPLARQRAGDLYLERFHDPTAALAQYVECLARYPRAWNAPEVRRVVERLRHEARP
jgi:tetratricopeptide (TPR) repeat protein